MAGNNFCIHSHHLILSFVFRLVAGEGKIKRGAAFTAFPRCEGWQEQVYEQRP